MCRCACQNISDVPLPETRQDMLGAWLGEIGNMDYGQCQEFIGVYHSQGSVRDLLGCTRDMTVSGIYCGCTRVMAVSGTY